MIIKDVGVQTRACEIHYHWPTKKMIAYCFMLSKTKEGYADWDVQIPETELTNMSTTVEV